MWRIKLLFSLFLFGTCLLLAAHTLPTLLSLFVPQNAKSASKEVKPPSQLVVMLKNTSHFLQQIPKNTVAFAQTAFSRPPAPRKAEIPTAMPTHHAAPSNVLQITLEDEKPPLYNPALGKEASVRLEEFLNERRAKNATLATDTRTYFGERAQQEVLFVLVEDEKASLNNALNSRSAQEFAKRQTQTDQQTQEQLNKIFEHYKTSFNKPLYIAPLTNSNFF